MKKAKEAKSSPAILDSIIAEGLRIQDRFRPEPLYNTTGKGSYRSQVVAEVGAVKARRSR